MIRPALANGILPVLVLYAGLGALSLGVTVMRVAAADPQLNPEEFKAVTLAKVAPYVQWPKEAWPDSSAPFVVGIYGSNVVEPILTALLKGQKLDGRDVVVKTFDAGTGASPACQLLFIPAAQEAQWIALQKDMPTFGILTVGESEDFTKSGGVFNLLVSQQKLEISLKNARKAGLEINSRLLKIAKVTR